MYKLLTAIAALLVLAACGGGASTSSGPQPLPVTTNPPTGGASTSSHPSATLTLHIPLPIKQGSSRLRPQYVSTNTTQLTTNINSVNGGSPPSWVTANTVTNLVVAPAAGSNCTNIGDGELSCTIPIEAPPGSVSYTFTAGDGTHNLSRVTTTQTIAQATNNAITVTLNGIVATVVITAPSLTANSAITGQALNWSAYDADGGQIIGSAFDNPITVTDNDATLQTGLSVNGGAQSGSVTLSNTGDRLNFSYTGEADNPFTLAASGTGISGSAAVTPAVFDITFGGTTLDDTAHGGLNTDQNWSEPTVFFAQASGSQALTGAEVGFTTGAYGGTFDLVLSPGCSGIATASGSPATSFAITATGVGVCKAQLKEHGTGYPITDHPAPSSATDTTHDGTFWISVTTGGFNVN